MTLQVNALRDDILRELTYTGRIFSAQEALSYGLATRICDDPRTAALEVAHEIAGKSPHAIRAAKRLFDEAWGGTAEETLALEAELQLGLFGSPNQLAAVTAGMTKQPPEFTDPA